MRARPKATVLIVDEENSVVFSRLKRSLIDEGFELDPVHNGIDKSNGVSDDRSKDSRWILRRGKTEIIICPWYHTAGSIAEETPDLVAAFLGNNIQPANRLTAFMDSGRALAPTLMTHPRSPAIYCISQLAESMQRHILEDFAQSHGAATLSDTQVTALPNVHNFRDVSEIVSICRLVSNLMDEHVMALANLHKPGHA